MDLMLLLAARRSIARLQLAAARRSSTAAAPQRGGERVLQPHHAEIRMERAAKIAAVNCWPRVVLLLHVLQISGYPAIRMNNLR